MLLNDYVIVTNLFGSRDCCWIQFDLKCGQTWFTSSVGKKKRKIKVANLWIHLDVSVRANLSQGSEWHGSLYKLHLHVRIKYIFGITNYILGLLKYCSGWPSKSQFQISRLNRSFQMDYKHINPLKTLF